MSAEESTQAPAASCVNMESVNRISKLPVVESTIQTATTLYSKVKDYNSVTQWTFSTAENTVHKAVEITKPYAAPVVSHLEGPIKKMDGFLCNGLDYVEKKVPAVKLPPGELFLQMYEGAKDLVNSTVGPAVESAKTIYEPTVQNAKKFVEPAVETAKQYVEPAVQNAKTIVEPLVQPVVDKAYALKEYGAEKLEEFLHPENKDELECEECAAGNVNNAGNVENGEPKSHYQ